MAITFSRETHARLLASIKRYFLERDHEEVGELKASLLLDFFLKEIGPSIYNRAVADAQAYMQERVGDLDGSCYEPELGYWPAD